ncbi:MAG: M20/M25/M40 family metallo-hydrolase [Oscillospiraceae bacterium]|nr:M20/M25/M40 family metallo-hydrolase [Oscillospiraceae bacterium]
MIRSERLVHTFGSLVALDAESYHERAIADFVLERLRSLGLDAREDDAKERILSHNRVVSQDAAGNLFAVLPATGPGDPVLFAGHLDTVAPGFGKKLVRHPDGMLTSDGTTVLGADDAAAVAEILEVLTVLQEEKIPHPRIEVLIASAEEPYARGSAQFDFSQVTAKNAYVLDLSGPVGGAALAAPTILSFNLNVRGVCAHAGFVPEEGVNALSIAAQALSRLQTGHVDPQTTVNFGTVTGGTARNIVPGDVFLQGEIRSMDNRRAEEELARIRSVFEDAAEQFGGTISLTSDSAFQAYRISEDSPTVRRYRAAGEKTGIPVSFQDTYGGSDCNHINEHGIEGIVIACGMNRCHTTEEWTSIDEMTRAAELVLALASSDL